MDHGGKAPSCQMTSFFSREDDDFSCRPRFLPPPPPWTGDSKKGGNDAQRSEMAAVLPRQIRARRGERGTPAHATIRHSRTTQTAPWHRETGPGDKNRCRRNAICNPQSPSRRGLTRPLGEGKCYRRRRNRDGARSARRAKERVTSPLSAFPLILRDPSGGENSRRHQVYSAVSGKSPMRFF